MSNSVAISILELRVRFYFKHVVSINQFFLIGHNIAFEVIELAIMGLYYYYSPSIASMYVFLFITYLFVDHVPHHNAAFLFIVISSLKAHAFLVLLRSASFSFYCQAIPLKEGMVFSLLSVCPLRKRVVF